MFRPTGGFKTMRAPGTILGLAARGQNPPGIRAAVHPGWAASLASPLSSRLASPAPRRSRCSRGFIHGLLALLAPVAAAELKAQPREFLLHTPQFTVAVRGGYSVPRLGGGGDTESLWDFTKKHLTVGNRDFAGSYVMAEVGIRGSERIDLVFALGHSPTSVVSKFREWEGEDGLPITQTTRFTTTPLTAGIKAYLKPRGRAIGSHIWVPRTFSPFVGIAGGLVWYGFEQFGEFVDYETYEIFREDFRSEERAPTLHLFTGMDISISPRLMLTGEARYGFAKGPFEVRDNGYPDFIDFPKLDLSGLNVSLGVGLRI